MNYNNGFTFAKISFFNRMNNDYLLQCYLTHQENEAKRKKSISLNNRIVNKEACRLKQKQYLPKIHFLKRNTSFKIQKDIEYNKKYPLTDLQKFRINQKLLFKEKMNFMKGFSEIALRRTNSDFNIFSNKLKISMPELPKKIY